MPGKPKKFQDPPVIVFDLYYNHDLFKSLIQQATEHGYGILDLRVTNGTIPNDINIKGLFTNKMPDNPFVLAFMGKGCSIVRLGNLPDPNQWDITTVLPDVAAAGRMAADHFAERQFKNVGFVGNSPWADFPYLYNAFHDRAIECGCECHLLQVKSLPLGKGTKDERYNFRMKQIEEWLKTIPKPVGILTYNDLRAARIYTTAKINGFAVPENIAIMGYGNKTEICESLPVSISSIDINDEEKAKQAFDILQQMIQGENPPISQVIIPPKGVIARQSTNLLAVPDPVVARALRFIWDHFKEQLSLDDVAYATGVSRSKLTRKFRKCLGHGVNTELRRKRFELSKKLLRSTGLTITDIAAESGFPSLTYFHTTFRNEFGMTPGVYREEMLP